MTDVNLSRKIRNETYSLRDTLVCLKGFCVYLDKLNKQRVLELSKCNKYQYSRTPNVQLKSRNYKGNFSTIMW